MTYFFLNIASQHKCLALLHSGQVLAVQKTDEKISDADLVQRGEQLLEQAKLQYKDLTHIACVVGPGGFTSLRVAVSYANTLADQLHIPVAGIHGSSVWQAQAQAADYVWLHATQRKAVFARGFGTFASLWPEPVLLSIDELQEQVPEGALWCGELLDDQLEQLIEKKLQETSLKNIKDVLPLLLKNQKYTLELLTPWYGREG